MESEKQRFVDVNGSSFPEQDGLAFWSRCGSEPVGPTQAAQNQPAVWAGSHPPVNLRLRSSDRLGLGSFLDFLSVF